MRLLLIQICTVLSLAAYSQKISPNNRVLIEGFPSAATYSIQLQYSSGESTPLGSSKVYVAALFPQLDKLKVLKEGGEVVVTVIVGQEIALADMKKRTEYARMMTNYNRFEPLPPSAPAGKILFFQPLTLSFASKGSVFYSMVSIGKLLQRDPHSNRISVGINSDEKTNALISLEFLRANIFRLSGNPEQ